MTEPHGPYRKWTEIVLGRVGSSGKSTMENVDKGTKGAILIRPGGRSLGTIVRLTGLLSPVEARYSNTSMYERDKWFSRVSSHP